MSCDGAGAIAFPAVVQRVSTLADGGLRVTFDLPEDAILAAAEMMAIRQAGYPVNVSVVPEKQVDSSGATRGVAKGPKRKSEWKAAKE